MNDNLQKLHANLGKIDPGFTRSYDEFSADMQDENKRRRLHTSLGKIDPGFTRTYDEFVSDMGFAQPAADTRPATPAKPRTQTFIENQTGEQHTVGEHDIDAFVKANPDIRVAADEEIDPSARAWSQPWHVEQRPVRRFDEAFKQGTKALVEGAKVTAANLVNQFTGSSRDAQRALEILEKHGNEKFNPREAFKKDRQEQYDSEMEAYRKNREKWGAENPRLIDRAKSMLRREVPKEPNNPFGQGRAVGTSEAMFDRSDYRPYKLVEEALKKGSIDDAKSYLSEKAQTPTWGDRVEEVASEKLLEQQPTEGIAAWVGNIAPQMVPNALAIAASTHPVTRPLARPLGMTGMGILSTASGGSAIAEARQYAEEKGIDVSESDVQKAGALATAIEIVTEIPPLEMYLAGAGRTIKTRLGKQVAKDIIDNPVARKEADELLKRVAKNIPGSLNKGTAANYLRQLTAEGLSEFVAEGSGTLVPLIYSEEEDYPELKEILLNGWEGAKAGFFMGAFLGGGSTLVNNRVQNQRRREQENVTFADTDAGIVEILGEKEDTYSVLKNSGEVTEIPKSAVKEWTTVNWSEFKQFSDEVAEESGKVVVNSSEIQQDAAKGYEILEAVVNPEIREDVDPMSSDSHIAARYQIALAEEQFDSAFEGSAAPFDKQHILTRDADEQKQILFEIFLDDSYTEEQHNAIAGLVQAAAINQKLIDQLSSMQEESLREQTLNLTKNVNEKTGTLVTGRIKDNDQPVAIIRGLSFDVNQEGAYIIDTETSDEAVYYIDAEGKTQVTTADMIEVEESMDVAEAIAELEQSERFARAISEQAINSEVDNLLIARNQVRAGQPSPGPWTIGLTATGPDGSTAQIIDFNEDGSITLDVEATDGSLTEVTVQPAGMTQYGFMQPETVTPESGNISPENEIISQETVENQPKSVENTPETEISDMETETIPPETEISPEEAERVTFMESLPIIESGKNQGQIDQRQMTPEQTLKYFEYQYGNERTLQAAIKQVDNMKKTLGREQKKLDNDPFNIEQTEKVAGIESELQIYSDYVNTARMAGIEEQMQRQAEQPTSVATDRQARRDAISTEEAGRVGTAAQSITEKWNDSEKVEGMEDVITLANGEKIPGRYVLTTSEAPSPSHDINRNFAKTEGFPTNDQGKTVNDRDYEADQQAQLLVQQRANNYDERAVQTPVVVSREGIVLSGNDRTMAGQIAARNGTDGAYVDYITRFAPRWGFTTEQVQAMPNPRVVFVPTIDLPYDTATFAKFNAEEKKTQSSLETAIKASKSVSRDAIIPLAQEVEKFDKLNDFYTTPAAVKNAVQILLNNGVIQPNEVARMMDGDALSAEGRSFFETLMLGSVLNEEALRQVDKMRSVRQTLMRTMPQLLRNASLSEYSLIEELNNAIHLLYDAKQSGSKVKLHLMQGNIFEATAEEIYSETEKLLSLMLEGEKDSDFRAIFDTYNARAIDLEAGQADMFEGILDKPELLQRIISSYGQGQETSIEQAGSPAVVDRQGEESGTRSDTGSTSTDGQQPDTGLTESLPNRQTIEGNTQENISDTDTAITDDQSSTEIEVSESQQKGEPAQPVDILDLANTVVKNNEIAREGEQVDPNPSEAQKQAGNYKKGHVNVQGFDITIENPAGSVRSGTDAQGNTWSVEMQNHYGYFKRTQGKDGDQIDVFVGPNPESGKVFVVDQVDPQTGVFDESKVMLGFDTVDEARAAYLSNYEEGWQGLGAITEVGVEDFKPWLYDGKRQRKAFSEYAENKPSNTSQTTSVFREEIDRLSKIFNAPVEVHSEVSTVTNPAAREAIESGRNVKGWYVDDKVHIYLPNAENVQDVQETFFHEVVAHKGIKDLLGENHRVVLESFFDGLPSEVQNELLKRFGNKYAAADEFIATVAERGEFMGIDNRNLFQRIVDAIREFFSGSNIDIQLSTAERMANDILKDSADRLKNHPQNIDSSENSNIFDEKSGENETRFRQKSATGHPDNESTQAARRLLEKRGIDWKKITRNVDNYENNDNFGKNIVHEKGQRYTTQNGRQLQFEFTEAIQGGEQASLGGRTGTSDVQREGNRLSNKLGRLKEGEFAHVERVFTEQKHFSFTGSEKIETIEDVVAIFDKLEDAAVENSFAVFVKDGVPTVQHLGIGDFTGVVANIKAMIAAADRLSPDTVYFIHNHPSGQLNASPQDQAILRKLRSIFGDKLQDGIIINLKTGKYATYDAYGYDAHVKSGTKKNEIPLKVYSFDKLVFDKNYNPESLDKVTSSRKVAEFISSHRLGDRNKLSFMVLDRGNRIVGNFFTSETDITRDNAGNLADYIIARTLTYGGANAIIYGGFHERGINSDTVGMIKRAISEKTAGEVGLLDAVSVRKSQSGYMSAADEGLLEPEVEYHTNQSEDSNENLNQEWVAYDPNQIKSATYNIGTFDPGNSDIRFRTISPSGFYSTVEGALDKIQQEKGTKDQFKAMLLKNGAKQAEMAWMGFDELPSKLTKREIQDWIDANRIEVEEVEKADINEDRYIDRADAEDMFDMDHDIYGVDASGHEALIKTKGDFDRFDRFALDKDFPTSEPTKYSEYTLPGGEGYKELLLTMPPRKKSLIDTEFRKEGSTWIATQNGVEVGRGENITELRERVGADYATLLGQYDGGFSFVHYDEENIIAHVRFNEREVNGKRVLFIEEIQSDWAQEGRRKGFFGKADRISENDIDVAQDQEQGVYSAYYQGELIGRYTGSDFSAMKSNAASIYNTQSKGNKIADMPFKNTDQWLNLAMRRMMRYAAENGFDRIAWTTGEQQAARYDLSKHVDDLEYNHSTGQLIGWNKNSLVVNTAATKETLPDIVGKEAAEKLLNNPERTDVLGTPITYKLKGEELKFGGEGMKSFYNQIIPRSATKLGKPFNAKVESIELPEIGKQLSIPVTKAMRESVMRGVPLFRESPASGELQGASGSFNLSELSEARDRFDNPANKQQKYEAAVEMIELIEKMFKPLAPTVLVNSKQEMAQVLRNHGLEEDRISFYETYEDDIHGVYYNGVVIINVNDNPSSDNFLGTWIHESRHAYNEKNIESLVSLFDKIPDGVFKEVLPESYIMYDELTKIDELLCFLSEDVLNGNDLPDNEVITNEVKPLIDEYLNYITDGRYKNNQDVHRKREASSSPRGDIQRGSRETDGAAGERAEAGKARENDGVGRYGRERVSNEEVEGSGADTDRQRPAYLGQSIFEYAREVDRHNKETSPREDIQDHVSRPESEENSPRDVEPSPTYDGQSIAEFAQEVHDYNDANAVRFRVQLDKDGLPVPPVIHAGMYPFEIAELVAEFKKHTDVVFRDVNKEMAKIHGLYTTFVDRARPLEKYQALMQEKGAKPGESVYWDYITSSSRATHLIQDYNKTRIEPLQESLRTILRGGKKSKLSQLPIYKWHIIDESTGEVINDKEISDYDRVSLYLQAKDIVEASTLDIADRGEEGFRKNVRDNKGDEVDPNDYIDEFEKAVGKKTVDDLWNKIRAVNKWALDLQLEYGLIDSDVYAKYTDGTRQHYVPQRGWRERDIAGNKLYYTLDKSSGPDNPFNVALVKARGRETLAGDPLAYMQSIGESTVMAALKNRTKQKFLDFAEANSDFARIHDFFAFKRVYYMNTGKVDADGNAIYERTYEPPSQEQIDADKKTNKKLLEIPNKQIEARQNYIVHKKITKNQYDRLMKRLSDQERKLRNSINVRYADSEASRIAQVTAKERQQHNVIILRDGKEYEIQFSQNYDGERVANALNRNFGREVDGDLKFMQNVNEGLRRGTRFMSAMMTQYNPTFSVANFIRDWGIGSISNMAEFGLDYQLKFMKNTAAVQPAVWKYAAAEQWGMGKEYSDGYYGKMMKEFFEDGAATGWSFLKDIEQLRTDMKRAVDPKKSDFILHGKFGLWNAAGLKQAFGMLTEASELTTRFAEYVTSREMKNPDGTPRFTREEAAIHAKEISVNFDRKGNQKFFGTLFSFFNATIQGTNKLFRMIRNPKVRNRMIGISAMLTAGGILQAMLMPDPDDDDDRMFTEWELMQNLCLGKVKIPLPQGLRAFWGFGTQMGLASRGMKGVDSALLEGTHYFFGELIPEQLIFWANGLEIDDTTDQLTFNTTMAVRGAIPTTMQPMYDVWQNTNFMGGTSYRTEFTNALADTKAERSLGKRNVSEAAQKISDKLWVWGGGDIADDSRLRKEGTKVVPAFFDVNPSVIETLTRGYAAGTGKFVMDLVTLGIQIADPEKEVDVSRMAIANVLWKQPRDFSVLESKLWKLSDKTSFYKTQYNEVKKNNPERYKRITSFHANSGQLGRRDPVEFQHRLWRDGTDENKMFGLIQMSEMLQKRIDAGLIGGEEAERQVDMLLLKFEELQ